jgi:DnaJ-class molecular chaperone
MFWHPDRNPSPIAGSEFKRVHAAYELLCDPQRLAEWRQTSAAEATPGDPVAENVGADLVQALILTLEEAASGCRRNVELIDCVPCRQLRWQRPGAARSSGALPNL